MGVGCGVTRGTAKDQFDELRRRADRLGFLLLTEVGRVSEGEWRPPYVVYSWDASPEVRLKRLRRGVCEALKATHRAELATEIEACAS